MEARKITIVATNVQKKYVLNSIAETLGELKAELNEAGISYDNMTFMEGLTRTEMKDNNSLLPTNVKRIDRTTGAETTTNELVFMLTNTAKKIKSGAMNRKEVYSIIKDRNLQSACVRKYGKNYTQCSTANLLILISEYSAEKGDCASSECAQIKEAIKELLDILVDYHYLEECDKDSVCAHLEEDTTPIINNEEDTTPIINKRKSMDSPYSDDEIDEMFEGIE